MASHNLSVSGYTSVITATATLTENTTTGSTRSVTLKLTVKAKDTTYARDGYYSVTCTQSGTSVSRKSYVCPGSSSSAVTLFEETFDVTMNSDNKTATINFSFSANIYSSSVGAYREISGTITTLTLTETTFKLTISKGTGTSITVKRGSSTLSNGATLYSGDVLTVTFGALTGYTLKTHTVAGKTFASGGNHTVTGNTTVKATASLNTYLLSITADDNITVTVYDEITGDYYVNGDSISHFSSITISYTTSSGYELDSLIVNGTSYTDGVSLEVSSAITIIASSKAQGLVYIYTGSGFEAFQVYIYNGSSWDLYCPYVYNGSSWSMCA